MAPEADACHSGHKTTVDIAIAASGNVSSLGRYTIATDGRVKFHPRAHNDLDAAAFGTLDNGGGLRERALT